MKTFEIYFHDLNSEARDRLMTELKSTFKCGKLETVPLAVIEQDESMIQELPSSVDRVAEWRIFSEHMEEYIRERTVEKYSINSSTFDLMSIITNPMFCICNVLKYTLRIMNNKAKEHDAEKIAHYIQLYWAKLKN